MLGLGKIISSVIGKNLDADYNTRQYQVEIDSKTKDTQTVEELSIPGYQYNAPDESISFFSMVHEAFKKIVGINDKVAKKALSKGEGYLYSTDNGGAVKADLYFTKDGKLMVSAPSLGISFDILLHDHPGNLGFKTGPPNNTGGGVAPPASPPSISGNDIVDGNGTKSTLHDHPYTAAGQGADTTGTAT